MSRGLGRLQRDVLSALGRRDDRGHELPLRLLKAAVYGEVPRLEAAVYGQRAAQQSGRKLRCDGSMAANLNRAIASLRTRGLVAEWDEWDHRDRYRHIGLTVLGLSEYSLMYSLSGGRREARDGP